MSIQLFPRSTTRRPLPRASRAPLALEGLEDRVVMSHAAPPMPVPAQIAAHPQVQASVPITVTGINLANVTQNATTGVLTATGTLMGTLLGHAFSTPLTATVTPAASGQTCPVLNLHLDAIHLNLLGLNVDTSPICLDITATDGPGNLLGNLLCDGLTTALADAKAATTAAATSGTALNLNGVLNDLNGVLGGSGLVGGLTSGLGQVTGGFAPNAAGTTTNVLSLSLGPVNLNLLGLNVHLDNCNNGPVTVKISATSGAGNLLGNLISGVAHLLDNPGNPLGGILSHINNILGIATAAPRLPGA